MPAGVANSKWRVQVGDEAQANQARHQLQRLQALPKPLVAATDLLAQRKLLKAENLCRQFLQKVPRHVEAMRLLADIGVRLGAMDDAEFLLESAVLFEPDNQQFALTTFRYYASVKSLPML